MYSIALTSLHYKLNLVKHIALTFPNPIHSINPTKVPVIPANLSCMGLIKNYNTRIKFTLEKL